MTNSPHGLIANFDPFLARARLPLTGVQRFVAALAEAVKFVQDNPDKAKASVAKILRVKDDDVLQSSYDAYARKHVNRRMVVPLNRRCPGRGRQDQQDSRGNHRQQFYRRAGAKRFLKELWGRKLP